MRLSESFAELLKARVLVLVCSGSVELVSLDRGRYFLSGSNPPQQNHQCGTIVLPLSALNVEGLVEVRGQGSNSSRKLGMAISSQVT